MKHRTDSDIRAEYAAAAERIHAPEHAKAAVRAAARALRDSAATQGARIEEDANDVALFADAKPASALNDAPSCKAFPSHAAVLEAPVAAAPAASDASARTRTTDASTNGTSSERPDHQQAAYTRSRRSRFALRFAAAACAAAVIIGVASVGVLGMPFVAESDPAIVEEEDSASSAPTGDFFTLVAYADEGDGTVSAVQVEPGKQFALSGDSFDGGSGGGAFFDPATGTYTDSTVMVGAKMILGPIFQGENIKTLSLEVQGENAWIERWNYDLGEHGMYTYQKSIDIDGEALELENARRAWAGDDSTTGSFRNMTSEETQEVFEQGYVSLYLGIEVSDAAREAGARADAAVSSYVNSDGIFSGMTCRTK